MQLELIEYEPRKVVNVHKHVDGPWFWDKYTASPYVGCRSGCEFCYARGGRYLGKRDPSTFDTLIKVKVNAAERLRKEIARLEPEIISVGDWQQPAEGRYRLSRQMLEVVLEAGFPLFILERSPLLVRDLDLLTEINHRTHVGVLFSISSLDPALERAFEPNSPGVKGRLRAMARIAEAGIYVGTALMPVIPFVGDDPCHLEDVIRATKDHGGRCVLGAGTTMAGLQAERTLRAATSLDPSVEAAWRQLYRWRVGGQPHHSPSADHNASLGLTIRDLCAKHGLLDRMPRYVAPGPLATNKHIAERLFLKTYDFELEQAAGYRIWAFRRAAWTVDEHPESIAHLHRERGLAGLRSLPNVGSRLASQIAAWLQSENAGAATARPRRSGLLAPARIVTSAFFGLRNRNVIEPRSLSNDVPCDQDDPTQATSASPSTGFGKKA